MNKKEEEKKTEEPKVERREMDRLYEEYEDAIKYWGFSLKVNQDSYALKTSGEWVYFTLEEMREELEIAREQMKKHLDSKRKRILNLTQHNASEEQKTSRVVDVVEIKKYSAERIREFLTFDQIPSQDEMVERAELIAHEVEMLEISIGKITKVMIGGAPFFMSTLERVLKEKGYRPLYAFSKRESTEEVKSDGSVVKKQVFRHLGFVEA